MSEVSVMKTPFEIGKTYYLPEHQPEKIQVPCPVCYGKKRVEIILGNDERVSVECDGCGLGFDGPRGFVHDYSYTPRVTPFTIAGVASMHSDEWYVVSTTGQQVNWKCLKESEASAMQECVDRAKELVDENMRRAATSNKQKLKSKTWSVRYHEGIIKDIERKIAWHRQQVSKRKREASHD